MCNCERTLNEEKGFDVQINVKVLRKYENDHIPLSMQGGPREIVPFPAFKCLCSRYLNSLG